MLPDVHEGQLHQQKTRASSTSAAKALHERVSNLIEAVLSTDLKAINTNVSISPKVTTAGYNSGKLFSHF